jgi:hypothetical protein
MKKLLMIIFSIILIYACGNAQTTYQRYDSSTKSAEYYLVKSQINSNTKMIEALKSTKTSYSNLNKNESISRSRIQGVISAKENENFRLNQKAYLLKDANNIEDINRYNNSVNYFKNQLQGGIYGK